jgi:glutaredoxin
VVFTTPYCATCGPVTEALVAHDPKANVVKLDATVESELAGAMRVKTAPTVFLANKRGEVQHRLVGPDAVTRYIRVR